MQLTGPHAATSTLGLDGGDDPWRQSRPISARKCREEGRGTSWRRQRASLPPPRRMARRRLRWDKNGETDALSRGADVFGYGTHSRG